jgi:uncharacterized protein YabN with tetrapyrrole methylase and pyrophosphatase domain
VSPGTISEEAGDFTIGTPSTPSATNSCVVIRTSSSGRAATGVTSGQVIEKWETLKARERAARGARRKAKTTISGVPKTLPALLRAYEVSSERPPSGSTGQSRTMYSTRSRRKSRSCDARSNRAPRATLAREEEMGDLLFAIANLSRKLGIEPEAALRRATDKFSNRFRGHGARVRRSWNSD